MKTRHENKGLRKLCGHPRRGWAKCDCPWHFNFKWKDTHYRFSLDKHLDKHVDSKSDAEDEAAKIRIAIKAGTFGQAAPREDVTLRQLADVYVERFVQVEHPDTVYDFRSLLNVICRTEVSSPTGGTLPFGSWRLTDLVTDGVERYREAGRATTGLGGTNRSLSRLRALFNWAIKVGYLNSTPFQRHGQTVVTLSARSPAAGGCKTARKRRCWGLAVCICARSWSAHSKPACGKAKFCRCAGDKLRGCALRT